MPRSLINFSTALRSARCLLANDSSLPHEVRVSTAAISNAMPMKIFTLILYNYLWVLYGRQK